MVEARTRAQVQPAAPVKSSSSGLGKLAKQVQKNYGGHVMHIADQKSFFKHVPTGIFTLDMGLLGGIPEGLSTMLYGWESSGKSTIAAKIAGNMQRKYPDQNVMYMDIEGTFDTLWAEKHGVDIGALYLSQPETGEMALDIAEAAVKTRDCSLLIVDSIAMLIPFKEAESSMEDQLPGLQARMIGKFLRKLTLAFLREREHGHWPTVILINQWRMKIGVSFGDPRVLPGGLALKFAHSIGIDIKNKEIMGKDAYGNETVEKNTHSFLIKKNKIGTSLRTGEFDMIRNPSHPYGEGFIDDADTVVTFGRRMGLIEGEGGSAKRVQGLDESFRTFEEIKNYFYSDLDFFDEFKAQLIGMQRAQVRLDPTGWM